MKNFITIDRNSFHLLTHLKGELVEWIDKNGVRKEIAKVFGGSKDLQSLKPLRGGEKTRLLRDGIDLPIQIRVLEGIKTYEDLLKLSKIGEIKIISRDREGMRILEVGREVSNQIPCSELDDNKKEYSGGVKIIPPEFFDNPKNSIEVVYKD